MEILRRIEFPKKRASGKKTSQPVLFSPAPKGGLVDPQNIGGFLERFGRRQDTPDMGFFERCEGHVIAQFWGRIVGGAMTVRFSRPMRLPRERMNRPFDGVAQFPDIARPGIPPERDHGLRP